MRNLAVITGILIAGAIIYSVWLWPSPPSWFPDTNGYVEIAADLEDFQLDELHLRPIGYPLILLLTGATSVDPSEPVPRALWYVHLLGYLGSVLLCVLVLRRLEVSYFLLLTFAIVALLPYHVEIFRLVGSDSMALVFLTSGIMAFFLWLWSEKLAWLLLASACIPFSALVRPAYQITAVALIGLTFLLRWTTILSERRQRLMWTAIALLAGQLLIVGGVMAFNKVRFGAATVSPMLGYYLTTRTIGFVERLGPEEFPPVRRVLLDARNELVTRDESGLRWHRVAIWYARPELEQATGMDTVALEGYLLKANLLLIRRAPTEYLREVARSLAQFWLPDPDWNFQRREWQLLQYALQSLELLVFFSGFILLSCLSVLAWQVPIRWTRSQLENRGLQAIGLIVLGVVLPTTILTAMVDQGMPRQRESLDLLILFVAILTPSLLLRIRRNLRQESQPSLADTGTPDSQD